MPARFRYNISSGYPEKMNFWPRADNLWRLFSVFTVEVPPTVVTGPNGLEGKNAIFLK
jgi:hypothetical protein